MPVLSLCFILIPRQIFPIVYRTSQVIIILGRGCSACTSSPLYSIEKPLSDPAIVRSRFYRKNLSELPQSSAHLDLIQPFLPMLMMRATQWPPLSSFDGMLAEKVHSAISCCCCEERKLIESLFSEEVPRVVEDVAAPSTDLPSHVSCCTNFAPLDWFA